MKHSIYNKILIGYIIFAALSLISINTFISSKVMDTETRRQASELYNQANAASTYYSNNYYNVYDSFQHDYERDVNVSFTPQDTNIWIVGMSNDILYSSTPDSDPEVLPDLSEYFTDTYYVVGTFNGITKEELLTVYSPIVNNYQYYGYVVMNKSMSAVENRHIQIMNMINISFIIIFAFSMIVLVIFSIFVYKPLTDIMNATKEYAKGNYDYEGLKIHSHDELRSLADSLTFMSGAFKNLYSGQKKFIANISHDFRSPLTSIKGYVEAMLDGTIPVEMQEKYLKIVISETERLTKLTGSLLTLNTFDANGIMIELSDFDIVPVIKDTMASFEGQCNAKSIKIKLSHEDKDYMVSADKMRIQQVIYNLIDNAIKFSPTNADIEVDVSDKNDKVFVSVKDYGIGISPENQTKIWDRFYKADDSRGKDKKGTGLGLAIVKEIINAHNENINVVSTEGVGTQFTFSLKKAKEAHSKIHSKSTFSGL